MLPRRKRLISLYKDINNKTQNFILRNSLTNVTKEQLNYYTKQYLNRLSSRASCVINDSNLAASIIKRKNIDEEKFFTEFKTNMDKTLSIPRPPVNNPCL